MSPSRRQNAAPAAPVPAGLHQKDAIIDTVWNLETMFE